MIKASKVVFISSELETDFYNLKKNDPIRKCLVKAIHTLRENAFAGYHIPKRLIPPVYIQKCHVNNLWKYDLNKNWRLLYTVTSENEVELISAILEWFDHKEYERRFGY